VSFCYGSVHSYYYVLSAQWAAATKILVNLSGARERVEGLYQLKGYHHPRPLASFVAGAGASIELLAVGLRRAVPGHPR
jgi:hypothetical protein